MVFPSLKKALKPKVAVYTTGGTILSLYDRRTRRVTPKYSGKELLDNVTELSDSYDIELHEFCNLPGPHLTPALGLRLAKEVQQALEKKELSGAVIIQGTDTLEEMSYLFHLLLESPKPVVFTGAMKSKNEAYADAQGNLAGAISLAASKEAREYGVMVYFNQYIHSARYVTKSHTNNMAAFTSPEGGPIGTVFGENILFYHQPKPEKHFKVDKLVESVQLIKTTCGMDDLLVRACVESGVAGIVIEALGAGNVPPGILKSLTKAISKKIPVVLTSRCPAGSIMDTYSYEGGGARLSELGIIKGVNLCGLKARIKLMVALAHSNDLNFLKDCFEN